MKNSRSNSTEYDDIDDYSFLLFGEKPRKQSS
jgi:hypothetical protein